MKKWILPAIAAAAVAAAVVVTVVVPRLNKKEGSNTGNTVTASAQADGTVTLAAADLSSDKVTFVRPVEGSKIEVLARLGDDGTAKVALGTCQSCNGAPGAYYTQNGDVLQCNNCGLTFDLSVIDQPGNGCHPITLDESVYTVTDDGVTFDTEKLTQYEALFTKVADH